MLVFALLAVFVAGLMVGRTPEFLGKKIRGPQMKLVVAYVLSTPIIILVFGSMSLVIGPGTSSILNSGMHGLSEVMYAFASVTLNNGSAFGGLSANTPWYDTTLGLAMLAGRFVLSSSGSPSPAPSPGRVSTPAHGRRWTPLGRRSWCSCSA